MIARAAGGAGDVWWLEGEAGIGKTALLDAVAAATPPAARVLRATGRESDVELAWVGVGELVGPLIDEGCAESLPPVQELALRGALARAEPDAPIEPYAVLLAVHGAVATAASSAPLVVLIDDVQWLDEASRLAVEYLAARLGGLAVAMVVAGRPEPDRRPPAEVRELGPVGLEAAEAVLAGHGVRSVEVCRRVAEETGGNPLLLHAVADALDDAQRTGAAPLPEVLPVPPSVLRLAERRLAEISDEAREALLVAATAPDGEIATIAAALAHLGRDLAGVEEAERAGLVEISGGMVRFGHPTWRSAAFHGADGGSRRAAHTAVAAAVADPVARAWHRGLGVQGTDEAAAESLEHSAEVLFQRAAPMTAARYLELAARLSPDAAVAVRRLRLAAEAVAVQGHEAVAEALLDRADALGGDSVESARRRRLRLRLKIQAGAVDEPVEGLRALAGEIAEDDPQLSAEVLLEATVPLVRAVRPVELLEVAGAAAERAAMAGDDRLARRADVALGIAQVALGDLDALARMDRYHEVLEVEGPAAAGPFLAEVVAPALPMFQRGHESEALLDALEQDLRDLAAAPVLVAVLTARAIHAYTVDLSRAIGYGREAVDLAAAIGRPALALLPSSLLVMAASLAGDREQAEATAATLLATDEPAMVQAALTGLAVLHLAYDELEHALALYGRLEREIGFNLGVIRWEAEWCEALIRARRPEAAERVLAEVMGSGIALLGGGAFDRVGGMLATDLDEAEAKFASSVAFFQLAVGNRVGEGRTELCWGERLRRARRRAAAREHLQRAVGLLEASGAEVWAERARRELGAATGGHASGIGGIDSLTPQELEIARLAATGASNQEIGTAVFLSPRTVETHLGSIYRKLGIRNRRQLVAMAATEPHLRT